MCDRITSPVSSFSPLTVCGPAHSGEATTAFLNGTGDGERNSWCAAAEREREIIRGVVATAPPTEASKVRRRCRQLASGVLIGRQLTSNSDVKSLPPPPLLHPTLSSTLPHYSRYRLLGAAIYTQRRLLHNKTRRLALHSIFTVACTRLLCISILVSSKEKKKLEGE